MIAFLHLASRSLVLLVAAFVLASCDHKDLCFDHPEHAPRAQTIIDTSYNRVWEMNDRGASSWRDRWPASFGIGYDALVPKMPEGVCVSTYSLEGRSTVSHVAATGGRVSMPVGRNSLLLYNDDTEYIVFDYLDSSVSAKATTRTRTRGGIIGDPFFQTSSDGERTITPPDPLFGHYIPSYEQLYEPKPRHLDVTLQPLVFSYLVRYEFTRGVEYVGLARGALAGMAESVFLHDGHTGPERATLLYDCTVEPWGVQAVVNSFGVPDYPNSIYSRSGDAFALNLEVRLKNGKTLNFDFDISEQMRNQPHGGVITVGGIEISDEEGTQGGSGFDVAVDDWGEYNDIIITL